MVMLYLKNLNRKINMLQLITRKSMIIEIKRITGGLNINNKVN